MIINKSINLIVIFITLLGSVIASETDKTYDYFEGINKKFQEESIENYIIYLEAGSNEMHDADLDKLDKHDKNILLYRGIGRLERASEQKISSDTLIVSYRILGEYFNEIKNYSLSIKWFLKGADAGDITSIDHLRYYNFNGVGVSKNETEAYKWVYIGARLGDKQYQDIATDLNPFKGCDPVKSGIERANQWFKGHPQLQEIPFKMS